MFMQFMQYYYQKRLQKANMLNRLKTGLFPSQTERLLEKAKVDKSHDLISNRHISQLINLIKTPKTKNQLLNILYKKLQSQDTTLQLKSLIILHACVRQNFDADVIDIIEQEQVEKSTSKTQLKVFVEQKIINFYKMYLKRICINSESYRYIKRFCSQEEYRKRSKIQMVSHGFKMVNLINLLLQSQEMFNKMGRYHINNNEILNMYMQLLQDMDYFNIFIKTSIKTLIKDFNIKKNSTNNVLSNIDDIPCKEEAEEIKHCFLYINEAQKSSDRLYEFYHNRYYYKTLRSIISFPSFLQIDNTDYNRMKSKTKKFDKDLVRLVKESKYDRLNETEPNINRTVSYEIKALTETVDNTIVDAYSCLAYQFKNRSKHEETTLANQE